MGVAESGVLLSLASHFDSLEAGRSLAKMEMRRVKVRFAELHCRLCMKHMSADEGPVVSASATINTYVKFLLSLCILCWIEQKETNMTY